MKGERASIADVREMVALIDRPTKHTPAFPKILGNCSERLVGISFILSCGSLLSVLLYILIQHFLHKRRLTSHEASIVCLEMIPLFFSNW